MNEIILASDSMGRKKLFKEAFGDNFRISVSHIDETKIKADDPYLLVKKLALLKARKVAQVYKDDYVLGFDTLVLCEGEILGKPHDKMEAREILTRISGKEQNVVSGYAIVHLAKDIEINDYAETRLLLKFMDEQFIFEYVEKHPVTRYAGGYGVQDHDHLVEILSGDMETVIGAPMQHIRRELRALHLEV